MSIIGVTGDPDKVCTFINTIIGLGNTIVGISKTSNSATYVINYGTGTPPSGDAFAMENSGNILLESGDLILLE